MSVSLTDVSYAYPVPDLDGSPFDTAPRPTERPWTSSGTSP